MRYEFDRRTQSKASGTRGQQTFRCQNGVCFWVILGLTVYVGTWPVCDVREQHRYAGGCCVNCFIDATSFSQPSADRRQIRDLGVSSARCRIVPTRSMNTGGSVTADE